MENDKITFNILGCCVSRDAIDYGKEKYKVLKYAAFVSPWTMLSGEKVEIPSDDILKFGVSNFAARCIQHDAEQSTFDFLKESDADYLILDMADARLDIIESEGSNICLTCSNAIKKSRSVIDAILGASVTHHPWDLPWDEFKSRLDVVLDNILLLYKPSHIIFHELYGAPGYIDKDRCFRSWVSCGANYNLVRDTTPFLSKVYEYCLEKLDGCHIVRQPENLLADASHKWGTYMLHYVELYYDYVGKAISIIISEYSIDKENRDLEFLRKLYSQKLATLRAEGKYNTLRRNSANDLKTQRAKSANEIKVLKNQHNREINGLQTQVNTLNLKVESLCNQLNTIKDSRSYKIGRALTYIPRKIRESVKKKKST